MTDRISVHWNLRRAGYVLGVPQAGRLSKPRKTGDTVAPLCMRDAVFVVSPSGRQYCRDKGGRWVHAWVTGVPCGCGDTSGDLVTYNPFRDVEFRTLAGENVTHAAHVHFSIVAGKPRCAVRR
jgi:hypothetical protein